MRRTTKALVRWTVCGVALAMGSAAWAAGMNCAAARSTLERTVCGNTELKGLDAQLQSAYDELKARPPADPAALQREQGVWLRQRDDCGNRVACLADVYRQRTKVLLAALRLPFDDTDQQAAQTLQRALAAQRAADQEFPLESALQPFQMREKLTTFHNTPNEDGSDGGHFPTRAPAGVTPEEWSALARSGIQGGGENGMDSYAMVDLDNDGQRDLMVNTYLGGTGLFSAVNIWRRVGERFVSVTHGPQEQPGTGDFYTLKGRGANQRAHWVRLHGRAYVVYVDSVYGKDTVSLLRPTAFPGTLVQWQIHYQYRFTLPTRQVSEASGVVVPYTLPAETAAALRRALKQVNPDEAVPSGDKPLCPPPPDAGAAEIAASRSAGPGHDSYEVVQDVGVQFGSLCRIGRLVDWFGQYNAEGLVLQMWVMPAPGAEVQQQDSYQVNARRRVTRVDGGPR